MNARQNQTLLDKIEALIGRIVNLPTKIFPAKPIEPVTLTRKLELAMEDHALRQSRGQKLVPNYYDINLSIEDHQRLSPIQNTLIKDWQKSLIDYARLHHYSLKTEPVLRLHADTKLRMGTAYIEARVEDPKQMRNGQNNADESLGTQQLTPQQLALLKAQLETGMPGAGMSSPSQAHIPIVNPANPMLPPTPQLQNGLLPPARLVIRLPQGQQIYRIEKPVIKIGRQLDNDIIVEDKRVSRWHAQIKYQQDGQFTVYDLGSTNGITINNTPHMRQHILRNGDSFTIGSYDFYFERR